MRCCNSLECVSSMFLFGRLLEEQVKETKYNHQYSECRTIIILQDSDQLSCFIRVRQLKSYLFIICFFYVFVCF